DFCEDLADRKTKGTREMTKHRLHFVAARQANDQARNTNVSSFVIRISFVILHSCFVIPLMEILRSTTDLATLEGPLFLAIGAFDGVHLGHQAVISTSARHAHSEDGTPVVVTFDPHPAKVLRPENPPHLITSTPH